MMRHQALVAKPIANLLGPLCSLVRESPLLIRFTKALRLGMTEDEQCAQRSALDDPGLVVLQPEPDFHADLIVLHSPILDLASDLGHLEPIQMPKRLGRAGNPVFDGLIDAVWRSANDFCNPVGTTGHISSLLNNLGQHATCCPIGTRRRLEKWH